MGTNCVLCGRGLNPDSEQRTVYGPVGRECFRKLDSQGILLREEFNKLKPNLQDALAKSVQNLRSNLSDSQDRYTDVSEAVKYLKESKGDGKARLMAFPGLAFLPKATNYNDLAKRDASDYRLDQIMQGVEPAAMLVGTKYLPALATLFVGRIDLHPMLEDLYLEIAEMYHRTDTELQLSKEILNFGVARGFNIDVDFSMALAHLIRADRTDKLPIQGMTLEELDSLAKSDIPKGLKEYLKKMTSLEADGDYLHENTNESGFNTAKYINTELSTREWSQLHPDDSTPALLHEIHRAGKISADDYRIITDAIKESDERFMREKGQIVMAHNHEYNVFADGIDPNSSIVPSKWAPIINETNTAVRNIKRDSSDCAASIKDIVLSINDKRPLRLHSSSLMFLSPCWKEIEAKGYMGAILQMKDGQVLELSLVKKPVTGFQSVYAPSTAQEVFNGFLKKYPAVKANPFGNSKNYEYLILAPGPVSESSTISAHETITEKENHFIQLDGLHLFALNASPRMSPESREEGTHLTQVAYTVQSAPSDIYEVSPERWHSSIKPHFGGSATKFAPTLKLSEDKAELEKAFENTRVLKNINESLKKATYLKGAREVTTMKDFIKNELSVSSVSLGDKLSSYSLSTAILVERDGKNADASEITNQKEIENYLAGHYGTNSATTRIANAYTRAQTNSDADPTYKNITSSIKRLSEVFSPSYYIREGAGLRGYKAEDMWAGKEARRKYHESLTLPILSKWIKEGKEDLALASMKANAEARRKAKDAKFQKKKNRAK